ncbi:Hsp70 family protein, partial [Akkermansiaceae bacterium]|nr:Hsp70 family protein [Akkermansiaceae bacterium]
VTFDIDANGILHVSAKDKNSGKEQKISIEGSSGLSDDEIEKAKRDAEAHAEEDKKRAEAVDIKNKGENVVYQVEKQLGELPEDAPAELKDMLTGKLDALKGAMKADDLDLIKSATEDLEKSLAELAQAAQAAGAQMPDMGGGAPDVEPAEADSDEPRQAKGKVVDAEVVDAEVKEDSDK